MKILHIGKYSPDVAGGIEAHTGLLISNLINCDEIEYVDAFFLRKKKQNLHHQNSDKNRTYLFHGILKFTSIPIAIFNPYFLRKIFRLRKYDIVHLHLPNISAHIISFFIPKKTKIALTWHSDIIRQKFLFNFYKFPLKRLLNRAEAIIVTTPQHLNSEQLKSLCNGNLNRCTIIPLGISLNFNINNKVLRALKDKYNKKDNFVIFAHGRHVEYKGFEYLIEAIKLFKYNNIVVILGGIGPLTKQLHSKIVKYKLENKIKMVGYIEKNEINNYYALCDVYCMPSISKNEAFGLVQIEAMLAKKPVVSFDLNNGASYINKNEITGITVENKNAAALAKAFEKLYSNQELRYVLGKNANDMVIKKYNSVEMAINTANLYKQILRQQ